MSVGEICNRDVVIVQRDNTVMEVAQLMRQNQVSDVVVVDDLKNGRVPIGIVTDHDLVVEVMSQALESEVLSMGDIMVPEIVTVKETDDMLIAIEYMRAKGVRRLPVVNDKGGLVGILTMDDLLDVMAEDLLAFAKLVKHEQENGVKSRGVYAH
jgi:CBS domain-containing protein